jgi:hypothetical protein
MNTSHADHVRNLVAATAAIVAIVACGSAAPASPGATSSAAPAAAASAVGTVQLGTQANPITGEIKDDTITLAVDHAGQSVWLELRNVGTKPCDIFPGLTSLPVGALPTNAGRVVIDPSNTGPIVPMDVGITLNGELVMVGTIRPNDVALIQLGLDGTPKTEERVILCNGVGDYALGRYAVLRFDR